MEHIAALLLIVGCSDGLTHCRELPAPVPVYEAKADCDEALPQSLGAFTGQFEQLFAQCIPVDPALEEEDAELTWDIKPDGTFIASVGRPEGDVMVASNSERTGDAYRRLP